MPDCLLLIQNQSPSTHEARTIRHACALVDGYRPMNLDVDQLRIYVGALKTGAAVPIGNVAYVREAMRLIGIEEPILAPYPPALTKFLHRSIGERAAGSVLGTWFVKPVETKRFTGFVFDTLQDPEILDRHDREQLEAFLAMPSDGRVWVSEPVKFVCEWRYYVSEEGQMLGAARYDDSDDEAAPVPDPGVVAEAAERAFDTLGHGFALDMGVLDSGETALVEINDAWSTGLYGSALPPATYLAWLEARWRGLLAAARPAASPSTRGCNR